MSIAAKFNIRRIFKSLSLIVLALGGLISCGDPFHSDLPKPTGVHPVGTRIIRLASSNGDSLRPINIQLYFPAASAGKTRAPYVYNRLLLDAMVNDKYLNLGRVVLQHWDSIQSYAQMDTEIAPGTWPLVLISHGFGMSRINYASFAENLASNGYIAITIDHFGSGFVFDRGRVTQLIPNPAGPDGAIALFCKDIIVILDSLAATNDVSSHVDFKRIGMMGHSLGGAAALTAPRFDNRIRAAINLDGYAFGRVISQGVPVPFMAILQRPDGKVQVPDSMRQERRREWQGIVDLSHKESHVLRLRGYMHFDFSDLPFLIPDSLRTKNGGTLNPVTGHGILNDAIGVFFDRYLKGNGTGSIDQYLSKYPQLENEIVDAPLRH